MAAIRPYVCALFAVLWPLYQATAKEETDYEKMDRVGGCPGIELFGKNDDDSEYPTLFFRRKDGQIVTIGAGKAVSSPDCKYFWLTEEDESRSISVFETASGEEIASFKGSFPAWSPDSKSIYMSKFRKKLSRFSGYNPAWPAHSTKFHMARMPKTYQLWSWSIARRERKLVLEVQNFCWCNPPDPLTDWYPVEFDADENIVWTYPSCDRTTQGSRAGKVLTIDPSTWEIKRTGIAELVCE